MTSTAIGGGGGWGSCASGAQGARGPRNQDANSQDNRSPRNEDVNSEESRSPGKQESSQVFVLYSRVLWPVYLGVVGGVKGAGRQEVPRARPGLATVTVMSHLHL